MKKKYMKPEQRVVKIQQQCIICVSQLSSVSSNADLNYGGGSNQAARVKQNAYSVWDDDWSE